MVLFQVKQQLPLKLAANNKPSSTASSASSSGVQQMLPLKLSQTTDNRRNVTGLTGITPPGIHPGYQRLSSSTSPAEQPLHSHSRTGSSPAAMMQNSPPSSPSPIKINSLTKNPYPKQQENPEEKVIFF